MRSRRRMVASLSILAVAVVALAAAGVWWVWLPGYRPALERGERYGIDVSSFQGQVDWPRVAGDDIDFAYVKATEGGDFVDRRFVHNWQGAAAAGLDRGAYHFFTLCTPGEVQARNFLDVVPAGDQLAPALDLELAGNCSARPGRLRWVPRFLRRPSESDWLIWQVMFRARVDGIDGYVDLDLGRREGGG